MFKKLLLCLFGIFGFSLVLSSNSFAVSDVTYTIDKNNVNNFDFCQSDCSTYQYVYIHDINYTSGGQSVFSFGIGTNYDAFKLYLYNTGNPSFVLYNIPFSSLKISGGSWASTSWSFKVTLSENNPTAPACSEPSGTLNITENGTFDVSNYASAVVNVPTETIVENIEDPISNDFQKVFFTIVEKIIPAFGILLVVWFGIDMLSSLIFGRGR